MSRSSRPAAPPAAAPLVRALVLAALLTPALAPRAHAFTWPALPDSELAVTAPRVEPGASAEVLRWRITIDDRYENGRFVAYQEHFVVVKLFDERAVRDHGTFQIPYGADQSVDEVDVRTVLREGRVVDLPHDAVYDRVLSRAGGRTIRMKTFVPAGLVPGAIVEYHVSFHSTDRYSNFLRVPLQMEMPVRRLELLVHPLVLPSVDMMYRTYQGAPVRFRHLGGGDNLAVLLDVPAARHEPMMPPEDLVRAWLLLYYKIGPEPKPTEFWTDFGRAHHRDFLAESKPGRGVTEQARAAVAGLTGTRERVFRLLEWTRSRVRLASADTTLTRVERADLKRNASPEQTLERGVGTWRDLTLLFAAAARACDLDVRWLSLCRRTEGRADLTFTQSYFFRTYDIGVRDGERWIMVDPAAIDLPAEMLNWDEEGATVLITGPDAPLVTTTPISAPDASIETRVARLTLTPEGDLEGTVSVTLTGHLAAARRVDDRAALPAERLDGWRERLVSGIGAVEVSEPAIEAGTGGAPYVYRCRVRVPGYAQRAGRRVFVQPSFFRRSEAPRFTASERRQPVWFDHAWTERDSVEITVPEGLTAEAASDPKPLVVPDVGRFELRFALEPDGRTLRAVRTLTFGEEGSLWIPQESYAPLKRVFDGIRERDAATLALTAPEPR